MSSEALHEPIEKLKPETINIHRGIVSLIEELEAIDWYRQRADACTDAQLRAILEHNMNEEIEHASMALEWIRRNVPKFDEALRTYLFTSGNVVEIEKAAEAGEKALVTMTDERPKNRATIGDMKGS
jgi:ferritin-like protein